MYSPKQSRESASSKLAMFIVGSAVLVAAGLFGAGPANADQGQDDQFVAAVGQIYPGESLPRATVLSNGHVTCDNLTAGSTVDAQVAGFLAGNPGDTPAQAQAVIRAAIAAFCPQAG